MVTKSYRLYIAFLGAASLILLIANRKYDICNVSYVINSYQATTTRPEEVKLLIKNSTLQSLRQNHVRETCKKYGLSEEIDPRKGGDRELNLGRDVLTHLLVDHHHRVVYCKVPKVASSHWLSLLVNANGRNNTQDVHHTFRQSGLQLLKDISPALRPLILDTYFKFVVVRHPLERALSAWRNKFETTPEKPRVCSRGSVDFMKNVVGQMQPHLASKVQKLKGSCPYNLTLNECVESIGDALSRKERVNEHWETFQNLCAPCRINYDYIGTLETMVDDSRNIVERLQDYGTQERRNLTMKESEGNHNDEAMRRYYKSVPPESLKRLAAAYALDAEMFMYEDQVKLSMQLTGG